jgi:hypothetical protein
MGAKASPPVDPATRAHILKRAETIGDQLAAQEAGVSPSSLRSWRHRARVREARASVTTPGYVEHGASVADLRSRAAAARAAERRALAKCDRLLADGEAPAAKSASQIASDAAARAVSLERAAREVEAHDARMAEQHHRLSDRQAKVFDLAVLSFFDAIGLRWPGEIEAVMVLISRSQTVELNDRGKLDVTIAPAAKAAARAVFLEEARRLLGETAPETDEQMEARIDREVRELGVEHGIDFPTEREQPADPELPADPEPEPEPVAEIPPEPIEQTEPRLEIPAWDELPDDWRAKYSLRPDLGRWEYAQHLRREKRRREEPGLPTRPSKHAIPTHPLLGPSPTTSL